MSTFIHIWALLEPKIEYTNLMNHCKTLWDSLPLDKQRALYRQIRKNKLEHRFLDYNPLLAIRHNMPQSHRQVMSYADYYARYGTTEEREGWKMANPTGQKVIYVKEL